MSKSPIRPKVGDDFFIGWDANLPGVDRRFLLGAGVALIGAGMAAAAGLAAVQDAPGPGTWDQGDVRDFVGRLIARPYPAVQVLAQVDLDGAVRENGALPRASLLGCLGKCGVVPRLEAAQAAAENGLIAVRGTLIQRGEHTMVSVVDGPNWVRPANLDQRTINDLTGAGGLGQSAAGAQDVGAAVLRGEILDTKCYFGAMRPSSGKVHKACAALCIKSGLPPAFYARNAVGRERVFLLTGPDGGPLHDEILPFVADPVRAEGRIVERDFTEFRIDPSSLVRL